MPFMVSCFKSQDHFNFVEMTRNIGTSPGQVPRHATSATPIPAQMSEYHEKSDDFGHDGNDILRICHR
eukprot:809376-Amorphochlora_amoeboformis.AAC.1